MRSLLAIVAALGSLTGISCQPADDDKSYLDKPVPVLCQADEVLYFEDYKGPGKNTIGELICLHVDDITWDR